MTVLTAEPVDVPANPRSRVIIASLIGTSIEFYDFYAYATAAALVFPGLFFPAADATAAVFSSLATFSLAFFARPLGSIVFGHFGDRIGRKATLIASLLVMGVATFLIGALPTYALIGVSAPILLAVLRFAQGFGLGGEWSGAALLATENAPSNRRAIWGTFPQLGAPIGFIIANLIFLLLSLTMSDDIFNSWGWRIPFLISAVLVIIGLYIRLRLVESPVYQRAIARGERARLPLGAALRTSWRALILGTVAMICTYVIFYFMSTFTLLYGTAQGVSSAAAAAGAVKLGLGYTRTEFITMLLVGVVFFGLFVLVSGFLAEKFGRRNLLLVVTLGIAVFGLLFQVWLGQGNYPNWIVTQSFLIIGFTLTGLTFGPMGAFLPELFPTNVRYTGSAIAYNVASILGAALAPLVALQLWNFNGDIFFVGIYLSGSAIISIIAFFLVRETKDANLDTGLPVNPEAEKTLVPTAE